MKDNANLCNVRAINKVRFESADEAWLWAFVCFCLYGTILVPYYCSQGRFYGPHIWSGGQQNPWRWSPAWVVRISLRRNYKHRKLCGGWHLTKQHRGVLCA